MKNESTTNLVQTWGSSFAVFITTKREEVNLSKNKLAKMAGMNRTTLSMMESKRSEPKVSDAYRLLTAMGLTFAEYEAYLQSLTSEAPSGL